MSERFTRTQEIDADGLDEEYQEMNDYVLMMNHDHYVDAGPEYSLVLNKIKKELGRRALEY
jgi:hypothetical protein